jgi:sugar phosphate isomerase/epimerase
MAVLSRREFLKKTATDATVAAVLVAGAARVHANPLGLPIGSQTWPHRQMIKDGNFAGLAKALADIGVQRVEMCSALGYNDFASLTDGKQVRKILADHGLRSESSHFSLRELREKQDQSLAWAKDVGITQIIVASLGPAPKSMDDVKKAADEYNKIAALTAKAGMQQGLHNEGFEVSSVDGKRTYDILMELLDPKLVKFQFQMSTISQGFVAAEYFTKYPGRFFSMHVQDVDLNATPPPGGRGEGRGVQVAVGKGSVDWVKTFTAAKTGGVKNYFVEQNMELTKASVAYLKSLKV